MASGVTLDNFNLMPSQDGIHDFSAATCSWIVNISSGDCVRHWCGGLVYGSAGAARLGGEPLLDCRVGARLPAWAGCAQTGQDVRIQA